VYWEEDRQSGEGIALGVSHFRKGCFQKVKRPYSQERAVLVANGSTSWGGVNEVQYAAEQPKRPIQGGSLRKGLWERGGGQRLTER